ncbi:MAG: 4Fe-4S binding protein [Hyphomicrobiales bacterium]
MLRFLRFEKLANTVIILLLLAALVSYKGKLLGKKSKDYFLNDQKEKSYSPPSPKLLKSIGLSSHIIDEVDKGIWNIKSEDNTLWGKAITTRLYAEKIRGYSDHITSLIFINKANIIEKVVIQSHTETPAFLNDAIKNGILKQWEGIDIENYNSFNADAISGSTLSSNAINLSIQKTLKSLNKRDNSHSPLFKLSTKTVIAILVILFGLLISIIRPKNKKLRTFQLLINTIILGLYCGQFISLNLIMTWLSNGVSIYTNLSLLIIVILAIILPLMGKTKYYCTWVCPLGATQELAGKISKRKWKIQKSFYVILKHTQKVITIGIFLLLWLGVGFEILQYEPFTAFIFQNASTMMIILVISIVLISIKVDKPWCRFICPTGQVLKWMEKIK